MSERLKSNENRMCGMCVQNGKKRESESGVCEMKWNEKREADSDENGKIQHRNWGEKDVEKWMRELAFGFWPRLVRN